METEDVNRVNMINTVIKFSDDNAAATAAIPAWAPALTGLKAKMVLINSYNQIASGTTEGVTTDTNILRDTMTEMALTCANATKGFANSINNNTLKALVNFTKGKLDKLPKEGVDDVCQGIHDATNTNLAGATNYGIALVDVTDLQSAIDLYRVASQNPRQAQITKSQANKNGTKMVREAIDTYLIGQMDPIVKALKTKNRTFHDAYFQAREIINLGSTTAKVRGAVVKEDNAFLPNVVFTITETGTANIVKQVETDAEGKFSASKLPPGDFDFTWTKAGYVTITETNVHIAAGKELQRKRVVMKEGNGGGGGGGVLLTKQGPIAPGVTVNVATLPAGTTKVSMQVLAGGPLENGLSNDGVIFNGNTITLGTNGQAMAFVTDFNSTGTIFIVKNQNSGVAGEYKIEFIG